MTDLLKQKSDQNKKINKMSLLSMSVDERAHGSSLLSASEQGSAASTSLSRVESTYSIRPQDEVDGSLEPPSFLQHHREYQASSVPCSLPVAIKASLPSEDASMSVRERTQAYDQDTWRMFHRIQAARMNSSVSPQTRNHKTAVSTVSSRCCAETAITEDDRNIHDENDDADYGIFDMDL